MSLIYWWPFTDNTVDKINNKTFTSTNWSFQSNGKIGNCFAPSWTDSNTISRQIYADNVSIPETFSVAVWVKNNNNFNSPRTYCPIQFSNGDCWISGANNKGWDFSHNSLRLIFNNGSNVSGSAGNAEVNWGYNPREFLGNWYHIAFTVNKTTRKAELFINGVSKGIKDLPSAVDTYGGTFKLKINWVQGWVLDGSLNDFRIYDHALSQAEVKELSKALVVHYTFNDTLGEPTTNLISNLHNLVNCTRYDNGVKIDWNTNSADTYFFITPRETLISGDIYTISFWCDGVGDNNDVSFAMSNLGNTHKFFIHDGYNEFTFTMNDTIANGCFLDDINRVSGKIFTLINIQLEKKDHATPYTPNSRESQLYNETGLVQPTEIQNLSLTKETNNGSYSGKFDSTPYTLITTPLNLTGHTDLTVACWVYVESGGSLGCRAVYHTINGSSLDLYAYGRSNNWLKTSVTLNTWAHIVITYSATKRTIYINGVEKASDTISGTFTGTPLLDLGYDVSTSGRIFKGLISDYRVYTTCLNSDDVKDLYKTKAYITDKGDIMCGEFIEDKAEAMVTEKGTFECEEIYEEIDEAYEQLEYIESTSGYTQCIDTGYYWQSEAGRIDIDMEIRTLGTYQTLFGNEEYIDSGSTRNFTHILHSGNSTGSFTIYNGSISSPGGVSLPIQQRFYLEFYTTNNKKVYIKKDGTFLINGNTYSDSIQTKKNAYTNSTVSTNVGHIFLFSNHNSGKGSTNAGTQHVTSMRVYNCKMYDNDVLVRNFIPCKRKSDNVLGLYDSVNKIFHTNAGSGTFVAGSVLTNSNASIYEDMHVSGRNIIEI